MLILMKRFRQAIASFLPRLVAFAVVLMPTVAHAQEAAPDPDLRGTPSPLIGFFVMFVMLAIVVSISLMPSKRGHQD